MKKLNLFAAFSAACASFCATAASAAIFQQISPTPTTYVEGAMEDFLPFEFSATDSVTGTLAGLNGLFAGCEASDFAGFAAGSIALIERGGGAGAVCSFELKVQNAAAAGAIGAIIYNREGFDGPSGGTLTSLSDITAISISRVLGLELLAMIPQGVVVTFTGDPAAPEVPLPPVSTSLPRPP